MTFRQFIQNLADKIGMHQIPVVASASEIRYFLAEDGVHHQFVTALVREIYKFNSCGHLDATIDHLKTTSLLGKMRANLLSQVDADICKVRLMNQLCDVSSAILESEKDSESRTNHSNEGFQEMA